MRNGCVLAQYSIRSKQSYVFKTNKVLEIVGASEIIARVWELLFECATTQGISFQRENVEFDSREISDGFGKGALQMVELFCGGGNETILFDSTESYLKLNRAFSFRILKEYPGLIPMAVAIKAEGDYSADYKRLMEQTERKKNTMSSQNDFFTVPFAMMDRTTFQPYSKIAKTFRDGSEVRVSDESFSKHQEGLKKSKENDDVRLFDEMVTKKGKESLLAVVHADGNNMGTKIIGMLHDEKEYDKAIPLMREFTRITSDCFEKEGDEALSKCRKELEEKNKQAIESGKMKKSSLAYRRIVGSGDDVTFVCNARFVMEYVKAYMNAVQNYASKKKAKWKYSSCAGICIFHSHYPFSRAYDIAEQACDRAKSKVHLVSEAGKPIIVEEGWVDFHFVHSGVNGDLRDIRRIQGTDVCMARPWLVTKDEGAISDTVFCLDNLIKVATIVKETGVARTSIKEVGSAFERSSASAKKELIHVYGHNKDFEKRMRDVFAKENDQLKALYDLGEVYDLWYGEVK